MAANTSTGGGGGATHAGTNYQDYVAAWVAVQILAEQDVTPPWGLPATFTLEALHAETPNPIDELTVLTSAGGNALSQAKHTVNLETTAASPLGSTIAQFVREYGTPGKTFDPAQDRFVLITSPLSSAGVKTDLPAFLTRMRTSSHPDAEWTAGSADQQHAASVLRNHLIREWQAVNSTVPTNAELTALTRLIHVHILDVDPGGQAATEAKNTLRQRILKDPTTADTAWSTLIATTGTYATNHQRADRPALQRALTDSALDLQTQRSYRDDVERLKAHATTTLATLLDFSRIHVGNQVVTIQRAPTTDARTAAKDGHLLILGVPGAGKSGALYELTNALHAQGADVVLFAVDQLEAASAGALRNELGLTHELTAILAAWPGTAPGYLMIDALDAARTDGAVKTLHTVMEQVIASNTRWRVIASVRKFDLRYNTKLQRLFHGTPPSTHTDNEFTTTRHVNVPTLTTAELLQVGQQSTPLAALMAAAPAPLQELLRLPFNLRLLAELLGTGVSPTELQPLQTQVELLDRYWQERIIRDDNHGDARELVLRRTTNAMVAQRALRIRRTAAVADDSASGAFLTDLLRNHVLAEWTTQSGKAQRDLLTFPHHLLFDYAVARLSIPPEHEDLIARLTTEPDLLLAIRPSIELHYQRLWYTDQASFWTLAFRILGSSIPEVGKLLAPSTAAVHAATSDQTQPLLECLQDPARHSMGIAALQHILATLLTHGTATNTVINGPWIAFLDRATATLTPQLTNTVRPYAIFLSQHVEQLTPADRNHLGIIARRLLAHALNNNDTLLTINSIDVVTKTITTNPAASVTLLRGCITESHLKTYGFRTLPALATNVPLLATADPAFVHDVYIAAFRYHEESKDTAMIGDSKILPLSSTKKQDYDHGLWQLGEYYWAVLNAGPREAIDALLTVVDEYVRNERTPAKASVPVELDDQHTSLLQDYSSIWDEGLSSQHDNPIKMLNAFQTFLERTTDNAMIQEYLHQVAAAHPPAVIWRRLLIAGANQPATIGYALRSLGWDHNILIEIDTTRPVRRLLQTIYATLTDEERERIENAIINIPTKETQNPNAAAHYRDRLIGCLDPSQLVTAAARDQYALVAQQVGPPSNFDDDLIAQWGTLQPAPTTEDPTLAALLSPVAAFAAQHLNTKPTSEAIATILSSIKQLDEAITKPPSALTPAFAAEACTEIARCTVAIARTDDLLPEQAALLLPIILRVTTENPSAPDEELDQTRPVTGWSTTPGITAAEAITILARHPACCTSQTRNAIQHLSVDPVPVVRFQVATRIRCLYKTAPDLLWELLDYYAKHEQNPTVIAATLDALAHLPLADATKTVGLTETIMHRTPDGPNWNDVRDACINIFCGLALWVNDARSTAILDQVIEDPVNRAQSLQRIVLDLAGYLGSKEKRITEAAFTLLHRALTNIIEAMHAIDAANKGMVPWPIAAQEQYGGLFRCADTVAQQLFFTSGAFKDSNNDRTLLPPDVFYRHAKPLFVLLAGIGYPHTAHYVLGTLNYFIGVDPNDVLLLVGAVVRAGSEYNYQFEHLAEGLMVEIVERYLAEYRPILRDHACYTALMDILDIFVRVGWPRAHQLTYQLGDIYR
jgi:signal recognition particle GTPase